MTSFDLIFTSSWSKSSWMTSLGQITITINTNMQMTQKTGARHACNIYISVTFCDLTLTLALLYDPGDHAVFFVDIYLHFG